MEKEPFVAVIIVNWNGRELLRDCLSSFVKKTNYKNYKLIVVDNGSTDGSNKMVSSLFKQIIFIRNKDNLGFSKANNIGIKYALDNYNPDYFLLLNNDTEIVDRDWLRKMILFSESKKEIGIVGCKLVYSDGSLQSQGGVRDKNSKNFLKEQKEKSPDDVYESFVWGACFLIKKEVILKIGGLDEIYSPFLLEETDYSERARERGFKTFYYGKTFIIHKGGQSMKNQENLKRLFILTRNDLIFYLRWNKKKLPFLIFKKFAHSFVTKNPKTKFKTFLFHNNFSFRFFITAKGILFGIGKYFSNKNSVKFELY